MDKNGIIPKLFTSHNKLLLALLVAILYNVSWYVINIDLVWRYISGIKSLLLLPSFNSSTVTRTQNHTKVCVFTQNNTPTSSNSTAAISNVTKKILNYDRDYCYDDAKLYKGQIIQSWPPNMDRSVGLYINAPFTLLPSKNKITNKILMVMVLTSPHEVHIRNKLRGSWMKHANPNTSVLFLLGKEPDSTNSPNSINHILDEHKKYQDIIYVEGLIEHYDNLTLKSLYAMKFFLSLPIFNPTSLLPSYFFKVDTDAMVNLPLLYQQLTTEKKYKDTKYLLLGSCYCCGDYPTHCGRLKTRPKGNWYRYHQLNKPNNTIEFTKYQQQREMSKDTGKWILPDYMYNGDKFPSYIQGGSGYVLSHNSVKCIYEKSKDIPYLLGRAEDVYITGFVAQACKIHRMDHSGFYPLGKKDFDTRKDISVHK